MIVPDDNRPVFTTSDQHLSHHNILRYTDRPFSDVEEMNRILIYNHNEIVPEEAVVFMAGDFTMVKDPMRVQRWLNALHGEKHLILGNHDKLKVDQYIEIGFSSVHTSLYLERYDVYMVHDPAFSCLNTNKLWLCGHIHTLFLFQRNALNVGVDMWDFRPVPIEEVLKFKDKIGGKK